MPDPHRWIPKEARPLVGVVAAIGLGAALFPKSDASALLDFLATPLGSAVVLALLIALAWWWDHREGEKRRQEFDQRLKACEAKHGECEDRVRTAVVAMVDFVRGDTDGAMKTFRKILED